MKYSKFKARASLIFTIIPYISAVFTNYIKLPFPYSEDASFKVIMSAFFLIAWSVLASIIHSMSDEELQKLGLVEDPTKNFQKYWLIEYDEDETIPCATLMICDNCNGRTKSTMTEYAMDLNDKSPLGIQECRVEDNGHLGRIYAYGRDHHTYIEFKFITKNEFSVITIDDYDDSTLVSKKKGICKEITPKMLVEAGIFNDEKTAKKVLDGSNLTKTNIKHLLVHIYKNQQTPFSRKVMEAYGESVSRGTINSSHDIVREKKVLAATGVIGAGFEPEKEGN